MVHCCDLKLFTKCVGLESLGKGSGAGQVQLFLVPCQRLPDRCYKVIWQLVAAYPGPRGMWERPHCELRLAATTAGPGASQQEAQGMSR